MNELSVWSIPTTNVHFLQIDIYVMVQPPSGEYVLFDTVITASGGRLIYTIQEDKRLPVGIFPLKMVVRYVMAHVHHHYIDYLLISQITLHLKFLLFAHLFIHLFFIFSFFHLLVLSFIQSSIHPFMH